MADGGTKPVVIKRTQRAFATSEAELMELPVEDNTSAALAALLKANLLYRRTPWPSPYDRTVHRLRAGDARNLSWIPDESIDLVVTSPPYWTLKKYEDSAAQLGDIADYELFLHELDRVWAECQRVLVRGGRI